MSDRYNDDIDDDFEPEDHSPAGLRKALEKAKREAKQAQAELAKEREARATAEKAVKKSTLKDLLETKGVKPGLARWLEKDDVEATPEAVDAWLKENGEFFNVKADAPKDEAKQDEQHEEQQEIDAPEDQLPQDLVDALNASQQLDQAGISPSDVGAMQRLAGLKADPRKQSYEELVAQLEALGAPLDK
jgi:hypothetical protein